MRTLLTNRFAAVLLCVLASSSAFSVEPDRAEEFCRKNEFSKALRQTIVFIDENVVTAYSGDDIPPASRELARLILNFADPEKAQRTNTFLPRERLTVYALPRDGSQPIHVFSACQPYYSDEEIAEIEGRESSTKRALDTFFGKGPIAEAEEYTRVFRNNLTTMLVSIGKTMSDSPNRTSGFLESSLITSLQSTPRLVNLHDGIPRIILVADFSPFSVEGLDNPLEARSLGFSMAKQASIDFSRAELYAVHLSDTGQNQLVREFAHAFFLGSGALLSGWSNKTISNPSVNPTAVQIFQGFVDYGDIKPPVQIRLAWDSNGTLVNSWIGVALKSTVSTPMSGAMVCQDSNNCSVKSDDFGFAQIWSTDPDQEAEYDANLPFSGLRRFTIDIKGTRASGKIWDPAVAEVGGKENLPFVDLTMLKEGVF